MKKKQNIILCEKVVFPMHSHMYVHRYIFLREKVVFPMHSHIYVHSLTQMYI